jgi:hypothetical protein
MITRPDVLVLGGGGLLGVEWMMGALAGIEDATGFDLRECEHFVGTSAGSIVAARLAGGRSLRRPDALGTELALPAEVEPEGLAAAALAAFRRTGEWTLAAWAPPARSFAPPCSRASRARTARSTTFTATSRVSRCASTVACGWRASIAGVAAGSCSGAPVLHRRPSPAPFRRRARSRGCSRR